MKLDKMELIITFGFLLCFLIIGIGGAINQHELNKYGPGRPLYNKKGEIVQTFYIVKSHNIPNKYDPGKIIVRYKDGTIDESPKDWSIDKDTGEQLYLVDPSSFSGNEKN